MEESIEPGVVEIGGTTYAVYRRAESVTVSVRRGGKYLSGHWMIHDDPLDPMNRTDRQLAEHFHALYEERELLRRTAAVGWFLPSLFRTAAEPGEAVPADLRGATVSAVGVLPGGLGLGKDGLELVIDYVPLGERSPRRLVLGFTELGMWVEDAYQTGDTRVPPGTAGDAQGRPGAEEP